MARREKSAPPPVAAAMPLAHRSSTLPLVVLGLSLLVFSGARFAALFNDLWLDEIWSLHLLREVHAPWQILTQLHHDNNHPLNSLFLYAVSPASADWIYRLLSFTTGVITIALGALLVPMLAPRPAEDRRARLAGAAIGAVLFGGCYLLIHYSSEARGYAPAVCCALAACFAVLRGAPGYRWPWLLLYWTACLLGLLAHVTFVTTIAAVTVWSVLDRAARRSEPPAAWWRTAVWHGGAWTFAAAFYFVFVRKLYIGGGPETSLLTALGDLSVFTFGLPAATPAWFAALVLVAVPGAALGFLWPRGRRAEVGLFLTALLVAPAAGLWLGQSTLVFPRYFVVSAAFMLLAVGSAITAVGASGRTGRLVAGLAIAGFLVGHMVHTVKLLRFGRGQYQEAIRYVIAQDDSATITVSSDADGRNVPVFEHHIPQVPSQATLMYLPGEEPTPQRPTWIFLHRLDHEPPPQQRLTDPFGEHYRFERRFPHAALSGWDWYVYRREPKA